MQTGTTLREHRVAIVGIGPKGLYCLERLVAAFNAASLRHPLHIAVFNRSSDFGASPVYDPKQPDYLLLNNSVGEIDLWEVQDPPIVAKGGADFINWYQENFPSESRLTGKEYLPRAVVGCYLVDGFRRIVGQLPAGVTVSCYVGEVVDIQLTGDAYLLSFVGEGAASVCVDKVMLSTGHSWLQPGEDERRWQTFAAQHAQTQFSPFVYPVEERMLGIPASATVAMLGIGLTFIDAVLALTEGRGGRFEKNSEGCLSYRPSGREPAAIVPFSRTGLPMTPKAHDLPIALRSLSFLTPCVLDKLRDKDKASGGKIDLDRDIWPLFELEMKFQYYRVELGGGPERQALESCAGDPDAMRRMIDRYLQAHPDLEPFDYHKVLDPAAEMHFSSGAQFNSFVGCYMAEEIARARLGQAGSGLKAAIDIWYEVRTALGAVLPYSGFTPRSHQRLVEDVFPRFKRVVFGPPIINIEKLSALHRAGMLDFSLARHPRVSLNGSGCYELRSRTIPGAYAQAEILVDARYPPVDVTHDATPLFRNLRRHGMIRAFENCARHAGDSSYRPGSIDITEPLHFVINESGERNEDIAVIGIPTEGNLVGNLTMARDPFAGTWAAQVIKQLQRREQEALLRKTT